jgi:hypothetical protein
MPVVGRNMLIACTVENIFCCSFYRKCPSGAVYSLGQIGV